MSDVELRMVGIEESTKNGEYRWQKIDRDPTPADLVAAVRRGVESGTIRGDLLHSVETSPISGHVPVPNPGRYLIIPLDEPADG